MSIYSIRQKLLQNPTFQTVWGARRRFQLHRQYLSRREYYQKMAAERGLIYDEKAVVTAIRQRLRQRGYTPARRNIGAIHTFAFIPNIAWHAMLYNDLRQLGRLTLFDYTQMGLSWHDLYHRESRALQLRQQVNSRVLDALKAAHAQQPVDWVFVYASGLEIDADVIRAITETIGVPTVNMCLDDKHGWNLGTIDHQRAGQIDLAPVFDLSWTSARVACTWYLVEGGRPYYLPPGFDIQSYYPVAGKKDIPVSFLGAAYGSRPAVIRHLKRYHIPVQTYGEGWPQGWISPTESLSLLNRSRINLGMGGIGYSESLTNVKGRDFEITGTGGGMYLTSFNPDLARHFRVGEEIICYRSREELVELIRYYLQHEEEAEDIVRRAYERSLKEHRWLHRYLKILDILEMV